MPTNRDLEAHSFRANKVKVVHDYSHDYVADNTNIFETSKHSLNSIEPESERKEGPAALVEEAK